MSEFKEKPPEELPPGSASEVELRDKKKLYHHLCYSYYTVTQKMKALQRRYPIPNDPEVNEQIVAFDKDRHDIHLQLAEIGSQLGRNSSDVLVDLVREHRTLEDYQLPEFSILAEGDIIDTNYWHNPYSFNIDTKSLTPNPRRENADDYQGISEEDALLPKSLIPKDKFMIVFSIVPVTNLGEKEDRPNDYYIRQRRAEALAKELGGELFDKRDTGYHEASARILGVMFSNVDLEKVAATIRDNPERFRLGKDFYSREDKKEIKRIIAYKRSHQQGNEDGTLSEEFPSEDDLREGANDVG